MAKQALSWRDSPPASEKRRDKVSRLLRNESSSAWGVTEAQSSFIYPRSLDPLRRIAGVGEGEGDWSHDDGTGEKEPPGLKLSHFLDEVFPMDKKHHTTSNSKSSRDYIKTSNGTGTHNPATANPTTVTAAEDINKKLPDSLRGKSKPADKNGGGGGGKIKNTKNNTKNRKSLPRPIFHTYGNGNTAPSTGGVVYGAYMLSHSITPQVRVCARLAFAEMKQLGFFILCIRWPHTG